MYYVYAYVFVRVNVHLLVVANRDQKRVAEPVELEV